MRASRTALVALAALSVFSGCAKPTRTVVLVTLDTTRADHLGCYGFQGAVTPALDAFAREGVLFEQAHATAPVTLPSHTSMFTGEYPPLHGVRYNGMFHVADKTVLLAERLRDAGFKTAAVPSSYPVARETGLDQGFEVYRDLFSETKTSLPSDAERKADEVTRLGVEWLEQRGEDRAFLWLHYFDPHAPYAPPFPFSAQFRRHPYDGEIAYMDQALGKLFAALKRMGRWDDAVILIAGDHGEGLYDHGEITHADLVYQSTIHVPLLVKAPGTRARRVTEPVSLVDVAPTLLELAGLQVPSMAGRSLVPQLGGKPGEMRSLYFESIADSLLYGWSPLEGVRRGRWKFVRSSAPELYDVGSDPAERADRHATDAEVAQDLDAELRRLEESWKGKAEDTVARTPLDPKQRARLVSLGYMAGAVSTERGQGRNPRDGIHLMKAISQGKQLLDAKQPAGALAIWRSVLEEDPKNRFVLLQCATACIEMKDMEGATRFADELFEAYPDFAPGAILLAELWVQRGDPVRAAAIFEAALSIHPDDRALAYGRALALLTAGRVPEARALLDGLVQAEPETPSLWLARAAARAHGGDTGGALADLEEAVERGYGDAEVLATEPLLEPLRRLPGFAVLAARVAAAAERDPKSPS